jgi:3-oxoacyl-[acyl-carrier-protein] synthase III
MKVSEITINHVAEYLRLEENTYTNDEIQTLINISKAFIRSYTGLTEEQIDTHEDFVIVVYILCEDMYDNRTLYVDKSNLNKVVDTILGMHSVNLL